MADEVFLTLSEELEGQGLSRKVVADMFGMALRSYQRRVQRLRESATVTGKTLWESVLEHLQLEERATRRVLFERFSNDDPEAIGAVLNDLTQSGLVSRAGNGASALFTVTADEDRKLLAREGRLETAAALVWLDLSRHRDAQPRELTARLDLDEEIVSLSLASLRDQGRISQTQTFGYSQTRMRLAQTVSSGLLAARFYAFVPSQVTIPSYLGLFELWDQDTGSSGKISLEAKPNDVLEVYVTPNGASQPSAAGALLRDQWMCLTLTLNLAATEARSQSR